MQEFHRRAFFQHAQGPGSNPQDHKNVFEEKERKEKVKRKEQQQTQPLLAASLVCKERWKGWMPGTCQGRAEGTWVAITNIHRRHLAL